MTAIRITPPAVLPVTIEAARAALRVDGDDLDPQITIWVKGITADLEHDIGQCVMEQTWEVKLARFPLDGTIRLPHPAKGIVNLKYLDAAGTAQALDQSAYRLNVGGYHSMLLPASGASWPATADDPAAVVITVKAGYGAGPAATPENIQLYILAKLAEQFDPATRMERDTVQSNFVARLLDRCRSYG